MLSWTGETDTQFEIFWYESISGHFDKLGSTESPTYQFHHDFIQGVTYQFKVRAVTQCKKGPFSPAIEVTFGSRVPDQMQPVHYYVESCKLKMEWDAPGDGGNKIIDYQVMVQGKKGHSLQAIGCGEAGTRTNCEIDLDKLRQKPFLLESNDLIVVLAAAINLKGRGGLSVPNEEEIRMPLSPVEISKIWTEKDSNNTSLNWNYDSKSQVKF